MSGARFEAAVAEFVLRVSCVNGWAFVAAGLGRCLFLVLPTDDGRYDRRPAIASRSRLDGSQDSCSARLSLTA